MKFYDGDLSDYIEQYKQSKLYAKCVIPYDKIKNIIISGPSGSGKYSNVLYYLSKFSPSKLRYEKKITKYISSNAFKTKDLSILIEEANNNEPITFFEILTAAYFH